MGHYERQILQPLQLALLLVANLQPDGVVTLLQLQRVLVDIGEDDVYVMRRSVINGTQVTRCARILRSEVNCSNTA